jgi:hypothetical protein
MKVAAGGELGRINITSKPQIVGALGSTTTDEKSN